MDHHTALCGTLCVGRDVGTQLCESRKLFELRRFSLEGFGEERALFRIERLPEDFYSNRIARRVEIGASVHNGHTTRPTSRQLRRRIGP